MDATLIVARVARAMEAHGLESILIGNAAAALHGAPVTTIDLDFLIRRMAANRKKNPADRGRFGGDAIPAVLSGEHDGSNDER